jgi:hypothetical protein
VQRQDGSVDTTELAVEQFVHRDVLTPSDALHLATALFEAAIELGGWTGTITD